MNARKITLQLSALALIASSLAACAAGVTASPPVVPTFAKKAAAAKTVKTPNITYITSETAIEVPGDKATVNLEFALQDEALARRLMQVGAAANILPQIDSVEFTLTGPNLAQPLVAIVPRAKFLDNKAVIQFNNLPAGAITISAIAKDAAGAKVIEANGGGAIKVGELTKVKLICVAPPATGTGHVRIELDCFSADCQPQPNPTPTSFVPDPVQDVYFHSVGDPHEDGANGLKFDNHLSGFYMALRTLTNDFMLVKHQSADPKGRWPGTTLNNAVAIQSNGELFSYYVFGRRMRLNGAELAVAANKTYKSPKGLSITCTSVGGGKAVIDLLTAQGDKVRIDDLADYLNLTGTIGKNRVIHEVKGGLGTFNNGKSAEGMLMRDGTQQKDLPKFLNEWLARGDELIFDQPVFVTDEKDDDGLIAIN
jgi:hypothetical protein